MFFSTHKTTMDLFDEGRLEKIVGFMKTMEMVKPYTNRYEIKLRLGSYCTKTFIFHFSQEETEDGYHVCDSLRNGETVIVSWEGEIPWSRIKSRLWEILVVNRP